MEITRKNFKESLPLIEESIKKADFLAIDTEFTGLINGRDVSMFDSPQVYYSTLLNGAADFLLIQYGLCAFYWNEEKQHYMHDAYNFYLFPRGRPGPEKFFLCQSSSLDFLAAQGFDFNKLIREGISYMTEPTETRLRENLLERQKSFSTTSDTILIPEENKPQIEEICKRVRQFLDEKKLDEMEIDRCNAFIRRLLFQELRTRFGNEAFFETKILENKNRVLKVTRMTSATEGKDRDALKRERELDDFDEAVGFSKVARMISQSEKLIIGHNMLLDILHTLNHFFQPLPTDYVAFKEFAHCMFPRLLDTKYMSSLPPFKDKVNSSVLQHLLATLSEPPFSVPVTDSVKGRGYQRTEDKLHEAGYDAYVTGLCFLSMHSHLSRMRGEPGDARVAPVQSAALKPFVNKLFLSKTAHQDSPYMNLTGDDPTPSREHVFHLTFPKEWQRSDLNNVFSPFGAVTIHFLDDTSALVALARRERAQAAVRALRRHQRLAVVRFADFVSGNAPGHGKMRHKNQEIIHPAQTTTQASIPDTYTSLRQGVSTQPGRAADSRRPPLPERVERPRSHSVSAPVHAPPARKRTSSGVFQVDEAEPPTKKGEPLEESIKKIEMISNGRRKDKEKLKEKPKQKEIKEQEHVPEKFDSSAPSTCVSAFKESDTWD